MIRQPSGLCVPDHDGWLYPKHRAIHDMILIKLLSSSILDEEGPMAIEMSQRLHMQEDLPLAAHLVELRKADIPQPPMGPPHIPSHGHAHELAALKVPEGPAQNDDIVAPEDRPLESEPRGESIQRLLAPPEEQLGIGSGEVIEIDVNLDPPAPEPKRKSKVCNFDTLSRLEVRKHQRTGSPDLKA